MQIKINTPGKKKKGFVKKQKLTSKHEKPSTIQALHPTHMAAEFL